jgi:5'-nucleotidase
MRILLSNDDGILAPGLAALRAAVAGMGEIHVVAPDSPQSAAGHAITLQAPLTVRKVHVEGGSQEGFLALSVDGRPADCVRLAIRKLLIPPPDLVLTGINAGSNVGINVLYSGTVAAAAEAAMLGIPAVAFSADMTGEVNFARAAGLCHWVLERLLKWGLGRGDFLNVNIPALGPDRPVGVRVVPQSTAELADDYHLQSNNDGREVYRLGDVYSFAATEHENDVVRLAEGYVTITPLQVDMTDRRRLADLARRKWDAMPPRGNWSGQTRPSDTI